MKACSCCRWGSAGVTRGSGALSPSQVHVTRVLTLTLPIRGQLHGARPHIPLAMCVTSPVAQEPGSGLRVEVPCVLEAGEDLQLGRGSCVSQGSGRGGWDFTPGVLCGGTGSPLPVLCSRRPSGC